MLKKCRTILMVAFAFVFTSFLVTACSNNKNADKGPAYEYEYDEPLHAECDAFMTIDGVLDEEKWADQNYLEWSSSGGVVKATTIFTNKGVYVGATAETDKVIWTARHAYNKNTHFWIQLVKADEVNYENYGGYDHPGRYLEYRIDAKNSLSYKERQYDAKGYFDGTLNTADSTVFSAELFVPWSEFGFSQDELDESGQPEAVKMLIHFRDPEKGINYPGFTDDGRYSTYYTYNAGGSDLILDPSMSIGHAIGKESATDQWDIDDENKTVRSTVDRLQVIWFREDTNGKRTSSATDCILETTIRKPENIYGNTSPYVGFMVMENKQMFSILGVSLAKWGLYNEIYLLGGRATDGGVWLGQTGFSKFAATKYEDETVRLKLIKRGAELFYFVNDEYQGTEYIDRVQGECEVGLYANGIIEFSDWAFTDYSGNQGALDDVLREYLHFVTPSTSGSGDLNLSTTRVKKGESLTISLIPQAENILKSFRINGEDKFSWFVQNATNAQIIYTPTDDEGDLRIEAEFEKVKEETKTLYITLKDKRTGSVLQGSTYSIYSGNNLFVYKGSANNNGLIITHLLPDGQYTAGEETFDFNGTYHFVIDCPEYMRGEFDLTVTKDNLAEEDIEWTMASLPWGTVTANGDTLTSQDEAVYDWETGGLFSDGGIQYLKYISDGENEHAMSGYYTLSADISIPEDLAEQEGKGNVVGVIIASGSSSEERIEFKAVEREKSKMCVRVGADEIILTGFPVENEGSNTGFTKAGAHWKFRIERRNNVLYVYNNEDVLGFTIDKNGVHLENSTSSSTDAKIEKFNTTVSYFFNAGRENVFAIVNYVEQGGNYLFNLDIEPLESVKLSSEVTGKGTVVLSEEGELVKGTEVEMQIFPDFGWEIQSVTIGEETYTSVEDIPSKFTVNENTVVSVVLTEMENPQYTVIFHSNYGEDETAEQKIFAGVQTALQPVEFANPRGVLLGWTTDRDGETVELALNEEVVDLNNGQWTVDLYAVWGYAELQASYDVESGKTIEITANLVRLNAENATFAWSSSSGHFALTGDTDKQTVTISGSSYAVDEVLTLTMTYGGKTFTYTAAVTVWAEGWDGYYQIGSMADLLDLPDVLTANYYLTSDITFDMDFADGGDYGEGQEGAENRTNASNAVFNKTVIGELAEGYEFNGNGKKISYSMYCNSGETNGNRAFIDAIRGTVKDLKVEARIRNAYYNCWFANYVYGTGVIEGCEFDITLTANSAPSGVDVWRSALTRNSGTMKNTTLTVRELGTETKGTLLLSWRLADERVGTYENVTVIVSSIKADVNNDNYQEGHGLLYNLPAPGIVGTATIVASYDGVTVKGFPEVTLEEKYGFVQNNTLEITAVLHNIEETEPVTYEWSTEDGSKLTLSNENTKTVTVTGTEYAPDQVLKLKATYKGQVFELETAVSVWQTGREGYYLIRNQGELLEFAEKPLTGKYSLEANIDFDMDLADGTTQDEMSEHRNETVALFNRDKSILGTITAGSEFDGNGHTISYSMFCNSGSNEGYAFIHEIGGTVKNLNIVAKIRVSWNNAWFAYTVLPTGVIENCVFDITLNPNSDNMGGECWQTALMRNSGTMKDSTLIVREPDPTNTKGTLLLSWMLPVKDDFGTYQNVTVYAENLKEGITLDNYKDGHGVVFDHNSTERLIHDSYDGVTVKGLPHVSLTESYEVETENTVEVTANLENFASDGDVTYLWTADDSHITLTNTDQKTVTVQGVSQAMSVELTLTVTYKNAYTSTYKDEVFTCKTTVTVWEKGHTGEYVIRTKEDLINLPEMLNGKFVLEDDIELDMTLADAKDAAKTIEQFNKQRSFLGTIAEGAEFDGQGHTISYSMFTQSDNSNLRNQYAFIHEISGTVKNLNIVAEIRVSFTNSWFAYSVMSTGVIDNCNFDITLNADSDSQMDNNCWRTALLKNSGTMKNSTLIVREENAENTKGTFLVSWMLAEDNKVGTYENVTVYADNVHENIASSGTAYKEGHGVVFNRVHDDKMYDKSNASEIGITVKSLSELPEITLNESYGITAGTGGTVTANLQNIDEGEEGNITYEWSTESSKLQLSNDHTKTVTVTADEYAIGEVLKLKATYRGHVYELQTTVNVWAEGKEGYYLIRNKDELLEYAKQPLTGKYMLEDDITFDMTLCEDTDSTKTYALFNKTILGELTEGSEFNGNGHTISYSMFCEPDAKGDHAFIEAIRGTVKNLNVVAKIRNAFNNTWFANFVYTTGSIENCNFDITLTANSNLLEDNIWKNALTRNSGKMKDTTLIVREGDANRTKGTFLLSWKLAEDNKLGTYENVTVYADNVHDNISSSGTAYKEGHGVVFYRTITDVSLQGLKDKMYDKSNASEIGITVKTLNEVPNVLLAEKYYVEKDKTLQITPNFRNIDPKDYTFLWSSEDGKLALTDDTTKTVTVQVNGDITDNATLKLVATSKVGSLKFERETTISLWKDDNGLNAIRSTTDLTNLGTGELNGTYVLLDDITFDMTFADGGEYGPVQDEADNRTNASNAVFNKTILGTLSAGAVLDGNGHTISYSIYCNSGSTNGYRTFINEIYGTVQNLNVVARIRNAFYNSWFANSVYDSGLIENCNFDITLTANSNLLEDNIWKNALTRNSGKMKDTTLIVRELGTQTKGTLLLSWSLPVKDDFGTYQGVTVYADNVKADISLDNYKEGHGLIFDDNSTTRLIHGSYDGVTLKSLSELPQD